MNRFLIAACTVALYGTTVAHAAGDADAGQQKSQPCQACHGTNGESTAAMYPKLAGQYATYLVKALEDYRSGVRNNPLMAPFAANLSDQDIEDLAEWFSTRDSDLAVIPAQN